ncbi:anti-sigma factor [Alloacidobacterium sp.]|uniref:anti-sigma factor n=1 Tax=Alloacidobacterium sp. TaxID=2951999 RepID=UPI002D69A392|nr:anti-sigma factor [Alloacidobacterium sp.]HYK35138.1 anti-sigma factor [Alloacidobacterium sp.]
MIYSDHIPEEDLALYALRSLAPADAAAQQHLNRCADCRRKLANILGDLSLVSLTVPQEPLPAEARERFMRRLRAESGAKNVETTSPARTQPPARSWNLFGGLGWIAAAAALLLAAYLGNTAHDLREQLDAQRYQVTQLSTQVSRAQQIFDVLNSKTAKRVSLTEVKAAAQPTAHVIYESGKGALIFVASDLRPVKANKTYELWLIPANGQAPIPAGLFRPDVNGTASVVLPPLPTGVDAKAFGVTIENAEGATTPTLPIVMSGQ